MKKSADVLYVVASIKAAFPRLVLVVLEARPSGGALVCPENQLFLKKKAFEAVKSWIAPLSVCLFQGSGCAI